jgi:hypothetical protein
VPRRWLLLIASVVLVAVGGTIGYLLRGGQVHSTRSDLSRLQRSERRLTAELAHTRAADANRLKRAQLGELRASMHASALMGELLSAAGARITPRWICSSRDFPRIHVAILSPSNGAQVGSPVIAHLLTDKPLGCASEYYVAVDGKPLEPMPPRDPRVLPPPESRKHPLGTRFVSRSKSTPPNGACFSGPFHYLRLRLQPGPHSIAIEGGCVMGTEVPQPTRSIVRFTVTP